MSRNSSKVTGLTAKEGKKHAGIMQSFAFNKNAERQFGYTNQKRVVSIKSSGSGIKLPQYEIDRVSSNGVMLCPEFVGYAFQVEGVAKKLLLFIIFHQLNPQKNTFLFTPQVIASFNSYCQETTGKTYSEINVRQALRKKLVDNNLVLNVSREKYMLNPMVGGCNTFSLRKTLISEYSNLLMQKGKDPITDFYPKY